MSDATVPTAPAAPDSSESTPTRRGRQVLGTICGFLLGLFIGLDLLVFGVIPLNSILLVILPIVGLIAGFAFTRLRS